MYDLRAFQLPQYCARVWLALCCLLGAVQVAHASKLPDFKQAGVTVAGNSAKIGMTADNVVWGSTIPISPTMGGWSYAGNYGIPSAAKGTTMNMSASGDVFFSGTKYPFQAGYTVPAANVFAGLKTAAEIAGGIMGGPVGLALIVGSAAAPYVKQWFDDSGLRVKPDGSNGVQRGDPWYCGSGTCYEYRGSALQSWNRSPEQACKDHATYNAATFTYYGYADLGGGSYQCQEKWKSGGGNNYFTLLRQARAIDAAKQWYDMPSMDDISPYMTPRPFDPRVVPEILSKGGDIPMPAPTITGPTALPGPQQVIRNPDGTTTTINSTSSYTISGDTITNITNITSTTITNSSSVIISTSTSTVTPSTTQTKEDQFDLCKKYPDSVACASKTKLDELIDAAKKTDCQKDPNGVGCTLDVPTGEIPKSSINITYAAESHFGGGSCPSNKTMQIHGGPSVTVANWTVICDQINSWVRPLVLVLAAFGALMVLAPGLREGTA